MPHAPPSPVSRRSFSRSSRERQDPHRKSTHDPPPESPTQFLAAWQANTAALRHTYYPAQEHDSCGVGFVAALDGKRRRDVVEAGIDALKAVWHRGAVDADGKTGDGAGIHVEIPQDFFAARRRSAAAASCMPGPIAVGMVFLPKTDLGAQERCRADRRDRDPAISATCIYGWRQVPIDVAVHRREGQRHAARDRADHAVERRSGADEAEFERDLYMIRRRIEKQAIAAQIPELYLCSLSCRSIIYKGMFLAEHLADFYPDLLDRALRLALRDLPPALFDQHLPHLAAGAAVPHAGA